MGSAGRKTSNTEVLNFLISLVDNDIWVYYHKFLPDNLKNKKLHGVAARIGTIQKTGNRFWSGGWISEYRIPNDIREIPTNSARMYRFK